MTATMATAAAAAPAATVSERGIRVLARATAKNPLAPALALLLAAPAAVGQQAGGSTLPSFDVDPDWPTLPDNWVLGDVASIAVDGDDDVWVLHRPRSVPTELRHRAAPPVLELGNDGTLKRSWGGPAAGYDWPEREHGIFVDADDYVWIGGNGGWPRPAPDGSTDDMMLKFTADGEIVMQIGARGASEGNPDTDNLHQPADQFVHASANELYVADGYGNRRVAVFDAETGAFKRMWGAFGNLPSDAGAGGPGPGGSGGDPDDAQQFDVVHAVEVSNDDIVYVADRGNQRVQWFTTGGDFIAQRVIEGEQTPAPAGFAFSPDAEQRFLYVVESANARVLIFERASMTLLGEFGMRGAEPGGMDIAHHIAVDSAGNLYTAEIANNRRAQKFVLR